MKKVFKVKVMHIIVVLVLISNSVFGQSSGNINYDNQVRFLDNSISTSFPNDSNLYITVKGLANVKADSYVAIFSVTQMGKTTEEVNNLIDQRINSVIEKYKTNTKVEAYVDMISFVPVYEYEVEKKMFSKKTYNEIPAGFELKKNIHVKFTDPDVLNTLISEFSNVEIYDLVRVDYFSDAIEATKKALLTKAKVILQEKMKDYETILSTDLDSVEKQLMDGYRVVLPVEMYKSYDAYSSSSLNLKRSANIHQANKSQTQYYQPIVDKEFDFVINPTIVEPVIQIMYDIKLKIIRDKKEVSVKKETTKEYILITPNGDTKVLSLN